MRKTRLQYGLVLLIAAFAPPAANAGPAPQMDCGVSLPAPSPYPRMYRMVAPIITSCTEAYVTTSNDPFAQVTFYETFGRFTARLETATGFRVQQCDLNGVFAQLVVGLGDCTGDRGGFFLPGQPAVITGRAEGNAQWPVPIGSWMITANG